jgi:hypothetical protein
MQHRYALTIGGSLIVNILLSWMILPFAVPPFQGYSAPDLFEVLLWQVIASVGWLFAILGGLLSLIFTRGHANLLPLLLTLVYPVMLLLLSRAPVTLIAHVLFRCHLVFRTQWLRFHDRVKLYPQSDLKTCWRRLDQVVYWISCDTSSRQNGSPRQLGMCME